MQPNFQLLFMLCLYFKDMIVKTWNTQFERRYIQKDYIPLNIWFGEEMIFSDLLHYRITDSSSIIEWHFDKQSGALKNFLIVNIDKNTEIRDNDSFIDNSYLLNAQLVRLYCNQIDWKKKENLFFGNYISDDVQFTIEKYKNAFKINFKFESINSLKEEYCKLSEGFIVSLSAEGKILSIIILNFNDFNEIW